MAGIGFVLRRLTRRDDLAGAAQAFAAAAAVTSGPWLITVLAIAGTDLWVKFGDVARAHETFRIVLTYDFCFSLVFTAPFTTVASRLMADQLFVGRADQLVGTFVRTLSAALAVQMPFAILFWFGAVDLPLPLQFSAVAGYAALVGMWIAATFLSVLRVFRFALAAFAGGMGLAVGCAYLLEPALGAAGLLAGFAVGAATISLATFARLLNELPYAGVRLRELTAHARSVWELGLIGLFSAAAPWADKWVMWFASGSERLDGGLRHFPVYDSAMFLAYLAMVPGLAAFFVIAETDFFLSYRRFFDELLAGASLDRIERNRAELIDRVARASVTLILLQLLVTAVAVLASPMLVQAGVLSAAQFPVFRFGLLGAMFHTLLNCLLVVMSYLDLRRDQIVCSVGFLLANTLLTALFTSLGSHFDGYGYFLAAVLTLVCTAGLVARRLSRLLYLSFITNNPSVRRRAHP